MRLRQIPFALLTAIFLLAISRQPLQAQQISDSELLKDIGGNEVPKVVNSYRGEKAVLVNIWATWCGPCKEEFPHIVKLQRKYDNRLKVIFISTDFNRADAIDFLREHGVDWTTYYKTGKDQRFINAVSDKWTGAMPFTKIIDKEGNVIASWENKADFDTFDTNVKKALNNIKP
ncbi:MAG: TlpA disulfide reductase family protein [Balneolaceae bacterium]|nr:TlpA disulfide reductase family protein [Balneolaceae bacterium]